MATGIKPSSQIFQVDKNGYLVSGLSSKNIQRGWKPAVVDFVNMIDRYGSENIKSVYLRGSVAFGKAIKFMSDLDLLIVTQRPVTESDRWQIQAAADNLNLSYDFITRFDVDYFTLDEILKIRERTLVKIMAICIFGEDIAGRIPSLKPGRDTAVSLGRLEGEITDTISKIEAGHLNGTDTKMACVWLMKRFVRSGFELVASDVRYFTRDLQTCWKMFASFYPGQQAKMREAFTLAMNPTDDPQVIKKMIGEIGSWLIIEGARRGLIELMNKKNHQAGAG